MLPPWRSALACAASLWLAVFSGQAETVPTLCPAIEVLDRRRTEHPEETHEPPTLVVIGTASAGKGEQTEFGDHISEIEIEQVLYGHWAAKTVRFSCPWKLDGRFIFHLAPASYEDGPDFQFRYRMQPEDLEAAKALCTARLTTLALRAQAIFVGQEAGSPGYDERYIKVLRPISGDQFKKGDKLRVAIHTATTNSSRYPRVHPGESIYFIAGHNRQRAGAPILYGGLGALPVEMEPAVRKTLQLRDTGPLIEDARWLRGSKFREVLFDGDVSGAIDLLSSSEKGAIVLGQRFLLHHAADVREPLMKEIAATMLRTGIAKGREFEIQKVRIATLGQLERKSAAGALAELAGRLLAQLEGDLAPVPMPERDEKKVTMWTRGGRERIAEERTTDVNHSLTWLLGEMEDAEIATKLEQRILGVRLRLQGWWRQEVELAIETADVDQNRQLREALPRMAGVQPVRSEAGLRHAHGDSIGAVAISPDGALLATGSSNETRVWSMADWHCLGVIPKGAPLLAFSPDGQSLFLNGFERSDVLFSRYNWRSGQLEKSYRNENEWIAGLQVSGDGRTMLTTSYMDESLIVWDTATGKKLRTALLPRISTAATLTTDGQRIARQVMRRDDPYPGVSESVIETLTGKNAPSRLRFNYQVDHHAFTPDGRYFLSCGSVPASKDTFEKVLRLDAYDLAKKRVQTVVSTDPVHFPSKLIVSPSGRYVAIPDEQARASVYELPGLKPIWATRFLDVYSIGSMAFTPDDKLLIAAGNRPTPYVLRMGTFEDTMPYSGHPTATQAVFFSPDGQRLWSVGEDGSVCHWDAATMKMTKRVPAPAGFRLSSIRPTDGKYALFVDGGGIPGSSEKPKTALVMDVETGAVVTKMDIALQWRGLVYWLQDDELLAVNSSYNEEAVIRLNFMTGQILGRVPYKNRGGPFYLARDRRSLLVVPQREPADCIDLASGAVTQPTVAGEGDTRTTAGQIYELLGRSPLPKKVPPVRRYGAYSVLSPDRRRLAVVSGARKDTYERTDGMEAPPPTTIRIHDAETLAMLCAFPASTRTAKVQFNTDASQLAVINDDGTIECWPLPQHPPAP